VESQIVRLKQRGVLDKGFREFATRLFQRRNKKVGEKRVSQLSPGEFFDLYSAERIAAGGVFVYPTDTVYGIGCDALNEKAVERVFEIKERDKNKPLSVAFSDVDDLLGFVYVDESDEKELREKLPGPYTFIVKNKSIPRVVTGGLDTIGVRVPDHDRIRRIIKLAGRPIVTTSANPSGAPAVNSIQEIPDEFLKRVDFMIDEGVCGSGRPSRIINLVTGEKLR
jgi:L-threonylcarbamoyladenylate synthase